MKTGSTKTVTVVWDISVYYNHLSLAFHFVAGVKFEGRKHFAEAGKGDPQSPHCGAG